MSVVDPPAKPKLEKLGKQFVAFEILECKRRTRAIEDGATADGAEDPPVFDIVLSTAVPSERWYGIETLEHSKRAVDMAYAKNGLSLLLEHGSSANTGRVPGVVDPDLHIGIVEDIAVDEGAGKLRGAMRFSRTGRAPAVMQDVMDRTRPYLSVGYWTRKVKLTKAATKAGEKDEYLVTRWTPAECSIVSVPQDPNAMVGRSAGEDALPVELETDEPAREESTMQKPLLSPTADTAGSVVETPAAPAPTPASAGPDTRALGGGNAPAAKEAADIIRLCEANGVQSRAAEFIERGISKEQVAHEILTARATSALRSPAAELQDALPKKDRKAYSLRKVMNSLMQRALGRGGELDGVEKEVHSYLESRAREAGIEVRGGAFVPPSMGPDLERETRTMTSTGAGKGAEVVFDQPGQLIEFLRNEAVIFRMGATLLNDLVGPVPFPRQQGDVTVSWVGENPAVVVAASDVATGLVTLVPKTMQGLVKVSRQFLGQTSIDAENMIRQSFGAGHGLAFDRAGLVGTGAAGQPTGIYFAPDVLSVGMANVLPTYAKITDMLGAVADANAHKGRLGFVATPTMAARLKSVAKITAAGSAPIWEGRLDDGNIDGYAAMQSAQMPKNLGAGSDEHAFIFGNWADMIGGTWGGVELVFDPYSLADSGLVRFISFQMGDVILRHPQSFCKATAAKLA